MHGQLSYWTPTFSSRSCHVARAWFSTCSSDWPTLSKHKSQQWLPHRTKSHPCPRRWTQTWASHQCPKSKPPRPLLSWATTHLPPKLTSRGWRILNTLWSGLSLEHTFKWHKLRACLWGSTNLPIQTLLAATDPMSESIGLDTHINHRQGNHELN